MKDNTEEIARTLKLIANSTERTVGAVTKLRSDVGAFHDSITAPLARIGDLLERSLTVLDRANALTEGTNERLDDLSNIVTGAALVIPGTPKTNPPPKPGEGDVWAEAIKHAHSQGMHAGLIDAMHARRNLGFNRYGTRLQRNNGRNFTLDLFEELLDGYAYAIGAEDSIADKILGLLERVWRESVNGAELVPPADDAHRPLTDMEEREAEAALPPSERPVLTLTRVQRDQIAEANFVGSEIDRLESEVTALGLRASAAENAREEALNENRAMAQALADANKGALEAAEMRRILNSSLTEANDRADRLAATIAKLKSVLA